MVYVIEVTFVVGELISHYEAERRGRIQDKKNQSYLFTLEEEYVVDALRKGNKTRVRTYNVIRS